MDAGNSNNSSAAEPAANTSSTTGTPTEGKGKPHKAHAKAAKGKGKGAAAAPTDSCANCGEEGDLQRCGGCGVVYYCRKNIVIKNGKKVNLCQQVSRTRVHAHNTLSPLLHYHFHHHLTAGALEVRRP